MLSPCDRIPAAHVQPGQIIYTTVEDGSDFGLPLVSPTRKVGGVPRTVRSHLREAGGTVIRFLDGTKTRPINGSTVFLLATTPRRKGNR